MTDKEKIRGQVNIKISNLRVAQEQGIITRFDEGKLEALEEIADFIDSLQEEPVSDELEDAADNALNNVLNSHEIVNIRSCLEMFKYGAQWKEKETLQDVKEKLLHMLNTSIDNKHFFEQLDDYIDALENK